MNIDSKLRAFAVALCAGSAALGGCRSEPSFRPPASGTREVEPPHLETRTKVDRQTGKLVREWSLLVYSDRPPQKQGVEKIYYSSGAKQWVREFDHGQPSGAWRSWYEDGNPRSESFFGDPSVDTIMTWWYPGGHVQSRGPARNGVHHGVWRFYYKNGQVAEEGPFFDNKKHGEWHAWSEDGKVVTMRKYMKGVRVSEEPSSGAPSPEPASTPVAAPTTTVAPVTKVAPGPKTSPVPPPPPVDLPKWPDDPDADERPPK